MTSNEKGMVIAELEMDSRRSVDIFESKTVSSSGKENTMMIPIG